MSKCLSYVSAVLIIHVWSFVTIFKLLSVWKFHSGHLQSGGHPIGLGGSYTMHNDVQSKARSSREISLILLFDFFILPFKHFPTKEDRGEICILLFPTWEDGIIYILMRVFHKDACWVILSHLQFSSLHRNIVIQVEVHFYF